MPAPLCRELQKRFRQTHACDLQCLATTCFCKHCCYVIPISCYFYWKRGTPTRIPHLWREFLRPSIRTADVPWTNDGTDRNSGCLRCLWLLFISSSVKLFKLNSKLMRGASQYIDIQQSSLAVSTNAPCTNATSESVFLIHEIIENKTLLRSSKLETLPAPGQKGKLLQTRLAAEMPLSRLRLRSARSACPNFLGSMVTSLAPNQATVPHGRDMSNIFKCT